MDTVPLVAMADQWLQVYHPIWNIPCFLVLYGMINHDKDDKHGIIYGCLYGCFIWLKPWCHLSQPFSRCHGTNMNKPSPDSDSSCADLQMTVADLQKRSYFRGFLQISISTKISSQPSAHSILSFRLEQPEAGTSTRRSREVSAG